MSARAVILISGRRRLPSVAGGLLLLSRRHTTSAQYVAARPRDPTFEKLMNSYKHLLKVVAVRDLILASPDLSLPLPVLSAAAQRLRLNRGAAHFARAFPHVFSLLYDPSSAQPLLRLTPAASAASRRESSAASAPSAAARLHRLLSMSPSRSLPLRAVFRVWRELGLPDDFQDSVLRRNPALFAVRDNPREPNTHLLELQRQNPNPCFTPAANQRRTDDIETKFAFKQQFPPGMKLSKNFRAKVKEWQRLPYAGPYEAASSIGGGKKVRAAAMEKRAVGIVHEFLSLTVEKMVEVEKISHFRTWFGIELNIRDLFLDHPGIFYLSTKGKRHTVFLREGYDRGRLVETNPIYEERMRLLELVLLRRRGVVQTEEVEGVSLEEEEMAVSEEDDDD